MAPNRADEILAEWSAVTRAATVPPAPVGTAARPGAGFGISLAGAALLALGLIVALAWLNSRDELANVGGDGTSGPPTQAPSPGPTSVPSEPAASRGDTVWQAGCRGPARHPIITFERWDGAAGSRMADIRLTNRVDFPCDVAAIESIEYASDDGTTLIGPVPVLIPAITLDARESVTSMVRVSNYCGPAPRGSISLGFYFETGMFMNTGWPFEQRDIAIAPCNDPNAPGTLEMQPWTPMD